MTQLLSPKKRFEQSLLELSRTNSIWTVFNDFLDFSLLFIKWWDRKETDYAELEKKYTERRHIQLLTEAYLAMGDIADHNGHGFNDPFGDFFMEHLSNDRTGQFFTPEPICQLIAHVNFGEKLEDDTKVSDPCCGSGRMLLAAGKINQRARFYGADVDLTCCKMTILNFMMNTLYGEVAWMNTLSMEHWRSWRISRVMNEDGFYLPYYYQIDSSQSEFTANLQKSNHSKELEAFLPTRYKPGIQIDLF